MQQITIERDAPVKAADGDLGRVTHVVVDPATRAVTEIVVGHGGKEWLIPIAAVVGTDGEAIVLNGRRDQFRAAPAFDGAQFEGVDGRRAEVGTGGRALRVGTPIQDGDEAVAVVGDSQAIEDRPSPSQPEWPPAPSAEEPILPPVAPMDVSEAAPMVAAALGGDTDETAWAGAGTSDADAASDGDAYAPRTTETVRPADGAAQHLELREERLRVEKEEVEAGVVRVRKVVREWVETIEVPLREERLVLEVLPGSGIVAIDGRELQPGDVLEIPLLEERAQAVKETLVSEDVVIRKEEFEVEETFRETLRREELEIDSDGDLDVQDEEDLADAEEYETTRTNA